MTLLAGARLVLPDRVLEDGVLRTEGHRIAEVTTGAVPPGATDLRGHWLVPGLVDIHVHGGGGGSFTAADPEQARTAAAYHLARGTTSILASLVTAPPGDMLCAAAVLADLVEEGDLAGIHLEGPFLAPARCGAHDPGLLRAPNVHLLDGLLDAGRGGVRQVTLAPELPGALDLIARLRIRGVRPALGHTDASYAETMAAHAAGARLATHLFNAMRPLHHREPGVVGALLAAEDVICEVIGDGVHLADATVAMLFATVGADRIALVTDAMSAAGRPDGDYPLGGLTVQVRGGIARLGDGTIAGGTAALVEIVRRTVANGVPVHDAVRAATSTPARAVGLDDTGSLEPGTRADLLVLDTELRPVAVMRRGEWVTPP